MGHLAMIPTLKTVIFEAEQYGCDPVEVTGMFLGNLESAIFGIEFTLTFLKHRPVEAEGWRILRDGIATLSPPSWAKMTAQAKLLMTKYALTSN